MQQTCSNVSPVYQRIRSHILSKGFRLKDIAEKAGIECGRFYRIMDGSSSLGADELKIICSIGDLEIDPKELLCSDILNN
ncbi:hypothetical protein [Paenibacillus polymyxa]|uniref:hypothetical protein n=1 Tax=Paenibacillus polymyxa TaxID=1406 RepID=UPI003D2C027A